MLKRPTATLPTGSLTTFEAVARLGSFKAAAESLAVSPAAVSQRIRALEDHLGVKLFERLNREVRLSSEGRDLAAAVEHAFSQIDKVLDAIRPTQRALRVSAAPSIATRWLAPRLDRFEALNRGVVLTLIATDQRVDIRRDPSVDVALRYGPGPYEGVYAERLLTDQLVVCCAPSLIPDHRALESPAEVRRCTLLRSTPPSGVDPTFSPWDAWLAAAGVEGAATGGPAFSSSQMAIEAAVAGRGLVLAPSVLVSDDIAAGRLLRPFSLSIPDVFSYWFLCRPGREDTGLTARFRRWLGAELEVTTNERRPN